MGQSINGPCSELVAEPFETLSLFDFVKARTEVWWPHIVAEDERGDRLVWLLAPEVVEDCAAELEKIAKARVKEGWGGGN